MDIGDGENLLRELILGKESGIFDAIPLQDENADNALQGQRSINSSLENGNEGEKSTNKSKAERQVWEYEMATQARAERKEAGERNVPEKSSPMEQMIDTDHAAILLKK